MTHLSNSLTETADKIAALRGAMDASTKEATKSALLIGSNLIDAKAACRHGEWLPFLQRTGVAERQAQRLMSLARIGLVPDMVTDLGGIGAALTFASKWRLPTDDEVVVVAFDDDDLDQPYRKPDCSSLALVYRSPVFVTPAGFYHVGGYDVPDPSYAAQVVSVKPWPGDVIAGEDGFRFSVVLMAIHDIMGPLLGQSITTTIPRTGLGVIRDLEHFRVDERARRNLPVEELLP